MVNPEALIIVPEGLMVCDQGHVTRVQHGESSVLPNGEPGFGWVISFDLICRPPGVTCGRVTWEIHNPAVHTTFTIAGWVAASALWQSLNQKERK